MMKMSRRAANEYFVVDVLGFTHADRGWYFLSSLLNNG